MIKIILVVIILIINQHIIAQGLLTEWQNTYSNRLEKVLLDKESNLYCFSDSNKIRKLDSLGNIIWRKTVVQYNGTDVDRDGNVYLVGKFNGTVNFDSLGIGFPMTSQGGNDSFIMKLDSSGSFIWARQVGGVFGDTACIVTADTIGNIFVTGSFKGPTDFNPGIGVSNISIGTDFVLKLDTAGNYLWAKSFDLTGMYPGLIRYAKAIYNGNINLLISIPGTGSYDLDPGANVFLVNGSISSALAIVQLDTNGDLNWISTELFDYNGPPDNINDVNFGINGNLYVVGNTYGMGNNPSKAYIKGFNHLGTYLGVKYVTSTGSALNNGSNAHRLAIDNLGNVYMCGDYYGTVYFDGNARSGGGVFLAKVNNGLGSYSWVKQGYFSRNFVLSNSLAIYSGVPYQIDSSLVFKINQTNCINTITYVLDTINCYLELNGIVYGTDFNIVNNYISSQGCDSSVINVYKIIHPTITITQSGSTMTCPIIQGAKYQWLYCDGTPVYYDTNATFTPLNYGSYRVKVTFSDTPLGGICFELSNCLNYWPVGVNENDFNHEIISLSPNPAYSNITISINSIISSIVIKNIAGVKIKQYDNPNSKDKTIDINNLSEGMYIVETTTNKGRVFINKFVKN
jgi:hypothetical protein